MATKRQRYAKRRQKRMARADNDLSVDEWTALLDAWNGCAYCGAKDVPFQKDCVLALSRGGRYTLDNIVPSCRSCNASKCNDEVTSWMRRKKLDEERFLVRHYEISRHLAERFTADDDANADDADADDADAQTAR